MDKTEVYKVMDENAKEFEDLASEIWDYAEMAFKEYKSCKAQMEYFKDKGFKITNPAGGMETAFIAEYGSGKPVIAILGEYDALPNLSNEADVDEHKPIEGKTTGQGCGHHILGTAAVEATFGAQQYLKENNMQGTVRYYGCPAEEGGCGKYFFIKDGCFDDVDIAISWHPAISSEVMKGAVTSLGVHFKFKGIAAHAAGYPDKGRSALDAAELMNVGVQFLREHIPDKCRIHYTFIDAGGAANVVPDYSELFYIIRAEDNEFTKELYERVCNIAKGAALMTGTEFLEPVIDSAYSNIIPNETLTKVILENSKDMYPIPFTEQETEYAKKFNKAFSGKESTGYNAEFNEEGMSLQGSTDFGDISWVVPSVGFNGCCYSNETVNHCWAWSAQGKSSGAYRGMHAAAKLMAACAMDIYKDPSLAEEAKKDFDKIMSGRKYDSLMPKNLKPGYVRE